MTSSPIDDKTYPTPAKIQKRIFAAIIDFIILLCIFTIIGIFFGDTYTTDDGSGFHLTGLPAFICFCICVLIYPIQEAMTGQTIGKRVFKLKVVSQDNKPHSFGQPIVRHLFDIIDMFPSFGLTGIIVASNTNLKQRVGDLVAKTIVVDE